MDIIPFDDPENIEDPAIREILGQYKKAADADDFIGQGESLLHLGTLYAIREQFVTAIKYYKQALAIQKEVEDAQGQSKSLSNIGLAHADLGHYNKAIKFHLRALEISREHNNQVAASNHLTNLAETYELLEQYEQAIQCLAQVQKLYQVMDVPHLLRKARLNLERLQKLQEEHQQANNIPNKYSTATLPNINGNLQLETSTTEFQRVQSEEDEQEKQDTRTANTVSMNKLPNDALQDIQDAVKASQEMRETQNPDDSREDLAAAEPTAIIPNIDDEVLFEELEEGEFGVDAEPATGQALPINTENVEDTSKIEPISMDIDDEDDTEDMMDNPDLSTNTKLNFIRETIKDLQYQLSIAEAIGDMGKKGDFLIRLATLYMKLHQYDNAIHHYEQAIVLFGVLGKSYFREEAERGILEAREQKWSAS